MSYTVTPLNIWTLITKTNTQKTKIPDCQLGDLEKTFLI
jgi:hypothetical protein